MKKSTTQKRFNYFKKIILLFALISLGYKANADGCSAAFTFTTYYGQVIFTNTSNPLSGSKVHFYWDFGDGTHSNQIDPVHNYTNSNSYLVCLTITDSSLNCHSTYCDTIIITSGSSRCNADFSFLDSNGIVSFTNLSFPNPGPGVEYLWQFGDGTTSTNVNPYHNYTNPGYYFVCLTINDSLFSCTDTKCDSIYVNNNNSPCKASFVYTDSLGNVMFTNTSSAGAWGSYNWNFGDGQGWSSLMNPTYSYSQSGIYYVCLEMYDSITKCLDTICNTIVVNLGNNSPCHAMFTFKDSLGLVNFTNLSSSFNGVQFMWDFGDGSNPSYFMNPYHIYNASGYYYVCLTMSDSINNCTDTYCDTIFVNLNTSNPCHAMFTFKDSLGLVNFTNLSSSFNGVQFMWDFGDGSNPSYFMNPYHIYNASGYYYVCLTMSDSINNCTDTYCDTIFVNLNTSNPCHAMFTFKDSLGLVNFTNLSSSFNGVQFMWDFGDGSNPSYSVNPYHIYNASGYYYVCLTMSDSINNCTDTYCDTIFVNLNTSNPCYAMFTFKDSLGLVNFTNLSSSFNGIQFMWDFGDGSNPSYSMNPYHIYNASGYYYVCLTMSDSINNCTNTYCDTIFVNLNTSNPCHAAFTYTVNSNGQVTFTNNSTPASGTTPKYYWLFGDGSPASSQMNPIHNYALSGTYTVCLIIHDSLNICFDSICQSVTVNIINTSCHANFIYSAKNTGKVVFTNTSTPAPGTTPKYLWLFGDGSPSSNLVNPVHYYTSSGTYTVCLMIYDSLNICFDSICKNVTVNIKIIGFPTGVSASTIADVVKVKPKNIIINDAAFDSSESEFTIVSSLENYPNPFAESTTISYSILQDAEIELSIVDILGKKVAIIEKENKPSGEYLITWSSDGTIPGIYLIQLKVNEEIKSKRIIINK